MAVKIVWTGSAWLDLENVADFIARDSPYYAAAVVRSVKEASRSLRRFAKRGRVVPEIDNPAIKRTFCEQLPVDIPNRTTTNRDFGLYPWLQRFKESLG